MAQILNGSLQLSGDLYNDEVEGYQIGGEGNKKAGGSYTFSTDYPDYVVQNFQVDFYSESNPDDWYASYGIKCTLVSPAGGAGGNDVFYITKNGVGNSSSGIPIISLGSDKYRAEVRLYYGNQEQEPYIFEPGQTIQLYVECASASLYPVSGGSSPTYLVASTINVITPGGEHNYLLHNGNKLYVIENGVVTDKALYLPDAVEQGE